MRASAKGVRSARKQQVVREELLPLTAEGGIVRATRPRPLLTRRRVRSPETPHVAPQRKRRRTAVQDDSSEDSEPGHMRPKAKPGARRRLDGRPSAVAPPSLGLAMPSPSAASAATSAPPARSAAAASVRATSASPASASEDDKWKVSTAPWQSSCKVYTTIRGVKTELRRWKVGNRYVVLPKGWDCVKYIASGTFGVVCDVSVPEGKRGRPRSWPRYSGQVAVKTIALNDFTYAESALRELHHLAFFTLRCPHPNIIKLIDCWVASDKLHLVLRRYEGVLIDADKETGIAWKCPRPARLSAMVALLGAVAHFHAHGLIHRDLKPGNVVADRGLRDIAVIDLGALRRPPAEFDRGDLPSQLPLTPARNCMTGGYMPPEVFDDFGECDSNEYGAPADVFVCGLIYYELLAGECFYDEYIELKQKLDAFLSHPGERLKWATKVARNDAGEAALLSRLLEPDPLRRIDAKEALEMVLGIAQLQGPRANVLRYEPQPQYSDDTRPSVMAGIVQEMSDKFNRDVAKKHEEVVRR
eukprot:TRINITY_DN5328_c1_g1_i1.p1 TRINITY_DN5328_c1_g1~~TRINITY_DN5328_c1_g1_i1.p1  ORF type:complete len:568 (+),score=182.67 TRINITY_DN5328_c1_g1_i1:120-1706(+)